MLGIYGENRLGKLFPKRSLVYPFILSPPQQQYMIPSCRSEKMINVTYRLKTRVILREPGEHRTPDQAFSSLTSLLPYWVPVKPTSNSTMETIAQTKKIKSIQRQSSTEDGSVTVTGSLSDWIAKEASQVEAFVKLDLHPQASQISHILGILIQVGVMTLMTHFRSKQCHLLCLLSFFFLIGVFRGRGRVCCSKAGETV